MPELEKGLNISETNSHKMPRKNLHINHREKILIAVTFVAIIFSAVAALYPRETASQIFEIERASISDLSTEGFIPVKPAADISENSGIIALSGNCYRMIAGTDIGQAQSIRDGLEGISGPRPNTHELMRDLFRSLDIELLMVKITELKGENFFGKILLKQGNTVLNLDSKPSDGIALAIRTGATVYFNETLMQERGEKIC